MAALWGILWTLSAIQEWLFGLVGLIEWFYWAVYHVVLFVAMVQRQTQSVIAALLLMPCCIPSQSAGPSSLGAVWELWLFDRGKARLALRVPTLQVTIDWVITGSNSELVLWENPSWYHFYWAIWMNYVDWNPICPLDWIGFYDNLENNLFQNWSSKYSRMHGSFCSFCREHIFSSFSSSQLPRVCLWMFCHCSVRRRCVCMRDVCMGEIICIGRPEMPLSILKVGRVDF